MSDSLHFPFGERFRFTSPATHSVRVIFAHYLHGSHHRTWRPPTDVYETDSAIMVKIELAGMGPDEFAISLLGRLLTVQGERKCPDERLNYHCMEIPCGEFLVSVVLPVPIIETSITAQYSNGFLLIRLPTNES